MTNSQVQNYGRILGNERNGARAGARTRIGIMDLKIGTINITTLNEKEEEVIEVMEERKLKIIGMSETRYKGQGNKTIHDNYSIYYKGRDEDSRHGVAIMLNEEMSKYVEKVYYVNERIIALRLKISNIRMGIIQVYAPQQGRPTAEKDKFYNDLQETYDDMNCTENTIIMGDLNGHVGTNRDGIENVIGAHSIGDTNEEGRRVIDFCVRNSLTIMNTCFKHRESHKWTWYRWDDRQKRYRSKTMIDLVLASKRKAINDVKAIPSVSMDGDHRMVVIKMKIDKPKKTKTEKKKRFMVENLNNSEVRESYKGKLTDNFNENKDRSNNIEHEWEKFREAVTKAAEESIGVKYTGGTKKKCTPWWNEDVKEAVKKKMRKFRLFMKHRTAESREAYIEARDQAENIKREAKRKTWVELGDKLEADYGGGRKILYSLAKRMRNGDKEETKTIKDKDGNLLLEKEEIEDRWREYFKELLNVTDTDIDNLIEETVLEEEHEKEDDRITEAEVIKQLKKMKNGKSPGIDGLTSEMYKEGGEDMIKEITRIFNIAWETGTVPKEWGKATICPIFKVKDAKEIREDPSKGDRQNCKNYRGISLIPHIAKLYERIIEKRLRQAVEGILGEWQYGFRPGRSTMDLIFSLKILMDKSWEFNTDVYMAFLDLEKAFDRVPRNKLWNVLAREEYNVPKNLLKNIKALYNHCESRVQDGRWFEVGCGVRQGSALSPLLFIIYMDRVVKAIAANEVDTLSYADDVALVAESEKLLQDSVTKWCEQLETFGMRMNKGKSEVMVLSRLQKDCTIYAEEKKLKEVDTFKYLGVNFNNTGVMEKEIDKRIAKYSKNLGLLYPLLKEKAIPTKVKVTIYKTVLRPILTYGCEAWVLTQKLRSRIQAAEMRVLRLIVGITRLDRIRNTVVRKGLEVDSILDYIEKTQLRWYGHVKRLDDSRYPKKYLEWKPMGKRPVGRPRMRWIQNVGEGIRRRGTTMEEIEEEGRYNDRAAWRTFIRTPDDSVQLTGPRSTRRRM